MGVRCGCQCHGGLALMASLNPANAVLSITSVRDCAMAAYLRFGNRRGHKRS